MTERRKKGGRGAHGRCNRDVRRRLSCLQCCDRIGSSDTGSGIGLAAGTSGVTAAGDLLSDACRRITRKTPPPTPNAGTRRRREENVSPESTYSTPTIPHAAFKRQAIALGSFSSAFPRIPLTGAAYRSRLKLRRDPSPAEKAISGVGTPTGRRGLYRLLDEEINIFGTHLSSDWPDCWETHFMGNSRVFFCLFFLYEAASTASPLEMFQKLSSKRIKTSNKTTLRRATT